MRLSFSFKIVAAFAPLWLLGSTVYSSDNSDSIPSFSGIPSKEYRPEIGVGLGVFNVFSDVKGNGSRSAFTNPLVYSVYAARRINQSFDLGLRFSTGGMIGNESGPDRYLNFKTILYGGSAFVACDFSNFFSANKILKPYLSLGISVFEFNNKGDLYDANGNYYYYWQDGTVRNVAENSAFAGQAQILQRDYVYETDLRKANLDGFNRYRQVGFGIPIGLELEFNVSDRVSLRLGTIFTYSFTDYLDNVTSESLGNRAGTKGGDHFLQHKLSLHFDLFRKLEKKEPQDFEFVDYLAMDTNDDDKDGIINEFDLCPFTIKAVEVTRDGCPVDLDEDGVPDYIDKQNGTDPGLDVHDNGVAYTAEDYLMWYMTFIDSLDVPAEVRERIAARKVKPAMYRVFLKEFQEGEFIADEDIADLTKEPDINVFTDKDHKTVYTAGAFTTEMRAEERRKELVEKGFENAEIVVFEDDKMMKAQDWNKMADRQMASLSKDQIKKREQLEGLYAVKLGSTKAGANSNQKAKYLKNEEVIPLEGLYGSTDYVTGPYIDTVSAHQILDEYVKKGYEDASIVKIEGGAAVPLSPARNVTEEEDSAFTKDLLTEIEGIGTKGKKDIADYEKIKDLNGKLVIKVGTVNKRTSVEEKEKLQNDQSLIPIVNPDQTVDYVYNVGYENKASALNKRNEFEKNGYTQPLVATAVVQDQELKLILEEVLKNQYTISLGSFPKGVTNDEINKILSIGDVKQLETFNPDVVHYTVGVFNSKYAAKDRMLELAKKGFKVEIINYTNNQVTTVPKSEVLNTEELSQVKNGQADQNVYTDDAVFRVQIGAFKNAVPVSDFKGVEVISFKNENGVRKYVTEGKKEYRDAYIEKLRLAELGFKDAFVVAYKDGRQIPLRDLVNDETYRQVQQEFDSLQAKMAPVGPVKYKVQVGAFKDFNAEHNKLRSYPNVEMEIYGEYRRILVGSFDDYSKAASFKEALKAKGYPNAFVVAYNGSARMSAHGHNPNVISKAEGGKDSTIVPVKGLVIRVQIGLYRGKVPADVQAKFDQLPKVTKEVTEQSIIRYLAGEFTDPTEATAFKEELIKMGFEGAFLVAYYNSDRIDIKKAIELFNANQPKQ